MNCTETALTTRWATRGSGLSYMIFTRRELRTGSTERPPIILPVAARSRCSSVPLSGVGVLSLPIRLPIQPNSDGAFWLMKAGSLARFSRWTTRWASDRLCNRAYWVW